MKIKILDQLSPHTLCNIANWIKENLTNLSIMDNYSHCFAYDCKITKTEKDKILIEKL